MEKYHENNIQKNYVKIVDDMKPKPMTRYLYQMKIIDKDDKEEIFSKTTSQDMNEALLSALKKGGPEAFPEFVKGLQERQPSLACMLLKEGKSTKNNNHYMQLPATKLEEIYFSKRARLPVGILKSDGFLRGPDLPISDHVDSNTFVTFCHFV